MHDARSQPLPGRAVVIGAGPAGLMAAEAMASAGLSVALYDAMPSAGRKFLLAGIGGLNLTHAEPFDDFVGRYPGRREVLLPWLELLGPQQVRDWAASLGVETFVGTSMRVFPSDMKAAPLLRSWLHRLRGLGVRLHMRHRWVGFDGDGGLRFDAPSGPVTVAADVTVLALGGGSWPQLGSDGSWQAVLRACGVSVDALRPANCGFDSSGWSTVLSERHAGAPVKTVAIRWTDLQGQEHRRRGEFVLTATGVEGSLIYAAAADLRDVMAAQGQARLWVDLLPDHGAEQVAREVAHPRGSRSLSSHLKSRLGLHGVKASLLFECTDTACRADPARLAAVIKALPVLLVRPRPLAEAISSAGGVRFDAVDGRLMLRARPGVFCAGEMLDWEAPTGGYLLTACLATGRAAGEGALAWLAEQQPR